MLNNRNTVRRAAVMLFAAVVAAGGVAAGAPVRAATPSEPVAVTGGLVRGETLPQGGAVFRGIRFAQPPLGALRWRPPAPPAAWPGILDATHSAPPCAQSSWGWNDGLAAVSDEDCLMLDVRTPNPTPSAKLPVMVWIHGGANRAGSSTGLVESDMPGVVLVGIQYRLDVFGFLSLPALTAESPRHASGNYALMDQIAALTWVRDNIARFGGDPANVTVFGESAGAQDIGQLQVAPAARGLFVKAIEESGTAGFGFPPRSLAENEALGEDFARLAGVPAGAAGLARLRTLPARDLLAASARLVPPAIDDASFAWMQAVVDGDVLPEAPAAALQAGRQAPVALLIGTNAQELLLHGGAPAIDAKIDREFGAAAAQARAFYHASGDSPLRLGDTATQLAADVMFRCPAVFVADRQVKAGAVVWAYGFDRFASDIAAVHAKEVPYVLGPLPVDAAKDGKPAPTLQAYWINFAKTADPNGAGLPAWPRYNDGKAYLFFTKDGIARDRDFRGAVCPLLAKP
jgi:para-nitrobenzyl esterase